jgi:hypothetical protein
LPKDKTWYLPHWQNHDDYNDYDSYYDVYGDYIFTAKTLRGIVLCIYYKTFSSRIFNDYVSREHKKLLKEKHLRVHSVYTGNAFSKNIGDILQEKYLGKVSRRRRKRWKW